MSLSEGDDEFGLRSNDQVVVGKQARMFGGVACDAFSVCTRPDRETERTPDAGRNLSRDTILDVLFFRSNIKKP